MNRRRFLARAAAAGSTFAAPIRGLLAQTTRDIALDPRRPQFHLLPAKNWMNDPNGPIYWNGNYHMFFQYNPLGANWGNMSWNHAISPDLIHWKHLPLALTPTLNSPDAFGCFSGTAICVGPRVYFVYTGVVRSTRETATLRDENSNLRETQCLAWSDDPQLLTWHKDPTPILPSPPAGLNITGFRDPSPWRQGEWYYMTVGSGIAETGGCVLLYRSPAAGDLKHWDYVHTLAAGAWNGKKTANPCDDGEMWECPDFFALDGGHVLIYSTLGKVFWQSGHLDPSSMQFTPAKSGLLDLDAFYAPKTQLDANGRRILWGWVPERRSEAAMREAGWSGMMSLPRVLNLTPDGDLGLRFLPELTALRGTRLQPGRRGTVLPRATGEVLVEPSRSSHFRLSITLPDSTKILDLGYTQQSHAFTLEGANQPMELAPGERPSVHVFVDGSVLEVILGERFVLTHRFYDSQPTAPDLLVEVNAQNPPSVEAWNIHPISPNRLTTLA